jgi:inosose dehydratase
MPQHLSRDERVEEDRAWLLRTVRLVREGAPDGWRPFAVLCEAIDEPARLALTGRTERHLEAQLDATRWGRLVDNLHAAAELVRREGLEPVFHPHAGTYIETAAEIDRLMNRIDPSLLGLCLDTGHFRYGGAMPPQAIRDYASLIRHVHVKDCRPGVLREVVARDDDLAAAIRGGVFCPLGAGEADIEGAIAALREVGYDGWLVVEQDQFLRVQDTPASLVAGQRANREFLARLGT